MTDPSRPGRPLFRPPLLPPMPPPEPGSLAARMAGASPDDPPPTLASALGRMTSEMDDIAGRMLHGAQWPEVKAERQQRLEQAARDAARANVLARRAAVARLVAYVLLLAALVTLAPAVVVMAWRVAL